MKCTRESLKRLSDVQEMIQLFDFEEILVLKVHCSTGADVVEYRQCRDANTDFVSVCCIVFLTCLENISQGVCVKSLARQSSPAVHSSSCLLSWKLYSYLLLENENIVTTLHIPCCGDDLKHLALLRS